MGTASNPQPNHERIEMIVYAVLIEHPTAGLILFETGCHDEMEKFWGKVWHILPLGAYIRCTMSHLANDMPRSID